MSTLYFVDQDGVYQGGWGDGAEPPAGLHEVPFAPDNATQIWDFGSETWSIVEAPAILDTPPVQIACVLQAEVTDGEVSAFGGAYRIAALVLMDAGMVLAIFTQHLGDAVPFAVSNNGVCMAVAEWGGDYAVIEIRDQAGGSLITPSNFGFSLYSL
ncbi:hypothetical protein [Neorhizobium galegae]|uniref:hypothetical protein n=1 Tax=Neorhizobium galegae TaxID=399 RepID=UPI0006216D2D|nr:hypothetical protein [Neorhizobium galegae]CDZ55062.1 Hypothetical protein NGAL_HAMBI2427_59720 [Neorhizobium galegae bv. orientalis]